MRDNRQAPYGHEARVDPRLQLSERRIGAAVVEDHHVREAVHLVVGYPLAEETLS